MPTPNNINNLAYSRYYKFNNTNNGDNNLVSVNGDYYGEESLKGSIDLPAYYACPLPVYGNHSTDKQEGQGELNISPTSPALLGEIIV